MRLRLYSYTHARIHPYTHARKHPCTRRHTTTQVTMTQRQLPPRTTVFASITKGICLHNKRNLPTQPKTSIHALQGICPHNQRHLPPQCKALASKIHALEGICTYNQTHMPPQCQDILRGKAPHPAKMPVAGKDTKRHLATLPQAYAHALTGMCPHNQTHIPPAKSPSSAVKSQSMKARLNPLVSVLLSLETLWYDLSSLAIDVQSVSRHTCHSALFYFNCCLMKFEKGE